MTPQEDHSLATGAASVSTTSRCSVPPNAPRKVVVKPPQYACDGSQMTDDIEDTFQDATTSPAVSKLVSAGYHQPALQLVHGKANVSSAAKRNDQQPAAVRSGKEVSAVMLSLGSLALTMCRSFSSHRTLLRIMMLQTASVVPRYACPSACLHLPARLNCS
jgi:hypothetical protein